MRRITITALVCCFIFLISSCTQPERQRIFDVHLHGSPEKNAQTAALTKHGVYKAAISSSWALQQTYVSNDSIEFLQGLMLPCPQGKVPYSLQQCFNNGAEWPDIGWVESLLKEKKIHYIGEVLTQYHGISSSDSAMYPYYALAVKYNVPVGIHTGSAGPDHGCPNFSEEMGNPDLLRKMLHDFLGLRVWIMHAGLPYGDEMIQIMKDFPGLYADISAINNPEILKPELFAAAMQAMIDNGFEDRIMFGSDNGEIETMIDAVRTLTFLSEDQKEKILFRNAERFFGK